MEDARELTIRPNAPAAPGALTFRDVAMPLFRHSRIVTILFLGIFLVAVLSALLLPKKYEAQMKILLNRDRADAVVTPDPTVANPSAPVLAISEEDINSEVALLKSHDLLREVVIASNLNPGSPSGWKRATLFLRGRSSTHEALLAQAVQDLDDRLTVEPLKKTNLIRVAYAARDPRRSANVLQNLGAFYEEKHAAVHRPAGTFGFFDEQTNRYREELATAEERLTEFNRSEGVIDPATQKQLLLQQLAQFESEMQEESSNALSAAQRVHMLRTEESNLPERQTTQVRRLDNAELLAQMQGTLLTLELKQSDMLSKYAPEYPPVREVETEIANTRKAIQEAQQSPIQDVITDRVPASDWVVTEMAKTQADEAQFESRAASTARVVRRYQSAAEQLDAKSTEEQDLIRNVKSAEDDYLLYLHKREEARISDELDSKRIVNVSIAEAPTVPALPTLRLGWLLVGSFFTASVVSVGTAYAVDRLDPSFRTPDELRRYLDVKVLAAIPASADTRNGNVS